MRSKRFMWIWSWVLSLCMLLAMCPSAFASDGDLNSDMTVPVETGTVNIDDDNDEGVQPLSSLGDIMINFESVGYSLYASDGDEVDFSHNVSMTAPETISGTYNVASGTSSITIPEPTGYDTSRYVFKYWIGGNNQYDGSHDIPWTAGSHLVYEICKYATLYSGTYQLTLTAVFEKTDYVGSTILLSDTIIDDVVWTDDTSGIIVRNLFPYETGSKYIYRIEQASELKPGWYWAGSGDRYSDMDDVDQYSYLYSYTTEYIYYTNIGSACVLAYPALSYDSYVSDRTELLFPAVQTFSQADLQCTSASNGNIYYVTYDNGGGGYGFGSVTTDGADGFVWPMVDCHYTPAELESTVTFDFGERAVLAEGSSGTCTGYRYEYVSFPKVSVKEPMRYRLLGWKDGSGTVHDPSSNTYYYEVGADGSGYALTLTAVYEKINYVGFDGLSVPATDTETLAALDAYAWTDVENMVVIRNLYPDVDGNFNYELVLPNDLSMAWLSEGMVSGAMAYSGKTSAVKTLTASDGETNISFVPVVSKSSLTGTEVPVTDANRQNVCVLAGCITNVTAGDPDQELVITNGGTDRVSITYDIPSVASKAEGDAMDAAKLNVRQSVTPGGWNTSLSLAWQELTAYALTAQLKYYFNVTDHDTELLPSGKRLVTVNRGESVMIEHKISGPAQTLQVAQVKIPYEYKNGFDKATRYGSTYADQVDLDIGKQCLNWMNNNVVVTPDGSVNFKFKMNVSADAPAGDYELVHYKPMAFSEDGSTQYSIDVSETLVIRVVDKVPVTVLGDGFTWHGEEGGPWKGYDYEGVIDPFRPDVFEYKIAYGPSDDEQIVEYDVDSGTFVIPGQDVIDGLEIRVQATPLGTIACYRYTDDIALVEFSPLNFPYCNVNMERSVGSDGTLYGSTICFNGRKMICDMRKYERGACHYVLPVRISSDHDFAACVDGARLDAITIDVWEEDAETFLMFYLEELINMKRMVSSGLADSLRDINQDGQLDVYDAAYIINIGSGAPLLLTGIESGDRDVILRCILADINIDRMIGYSDAVLWCGGNIKR